MPRLPRTVFAGLPHHVTQRGNRREDIFFTDEDLEAYLSWLKEYSDKHQVELLAYCLMTNHIHLVAIPATDDGLHRMLKPLHMRLLISLAYFMPKQVISSQQIEYKKFLIIIFGSFRCQITVTVKNSDKKSTPKGA